MVKRILLVFCAMIFAIPLPPARAQGGASLEGTVKDSQTGDGLPGANVVLAGTSFGGSTDISGRYIIRNVPPGSYTVRATYIGYQSFEAPIRIEAGTAARRDFQLAGVAIEGETVVVTAQAQGQSAAINQQLAASQIVSVVSSARIQELPDANAAESVGRLPGRYRLEDRPLPECGRPLHPGLRSGASSLAEET